MAASFGVVEYRAPQALVLRGCAIFLDIDGTLLDLAATPQDVIVPPHLRHLLHGLSVRLSGALALISGRSLADIDALFGPGLAVAAEHGAVLREADGQFVSRPPQNPALAAMAGPLRALVAAHPGALLEEKHFGLVLHWRNAPHSAAALREAAAALAAPHPGLMLQPAHAAVEIRQLGPDKASALDQFLLTPPFAGRRPVFVGDDITDEPAIARASALGGQGLHVGRDFGGQPAAVLSWLEAALAREGQA